VAQWCLLYILLRNLHLVPIRNQDKESEAAWPRPAGAPQADLLLRSVPFRERQGRRTLGHHRDNPSPRRVEERQRKIL